MFQLPLGIYGHLYAMCAFIGCAYVVGSFALGMMEEAGADDAGTGDVDGDAMVDTSGGTDGDGAGDVSGDDMGSAPSAASTRVVPITTVHSGFGKIGTGIGRFFMSLLSPMAVAMFVGFFGLGGLLAAYQWPWLGAFTLVVAIGMALVCTGLLKACIKWMFRNMHSSSSASNDDIIGQTAEVNIPISLERPGEVIYVVHSKRYSSAAQLLNKGTELKRGAKVVIVDIKDHLVYVEPCDV
jgi:membrane protein implicated in regulation of membrane protease activity